MDLLLQGELSPVPLSLATVDGKLRSASNKADLSHILQEHTVQNNAPSNHTQNCTIIDGMAAVQSIGNRPGAKTFGEWCDIFLKYVASHFSERCSRVDVVFDRYLENSIKGGTRAKRKSGKDKGIKRNVDSRQQKIGNWDRFIILGENKASLVNFLCTEISQMYRGHPRKELVLSGGFNDPMKVWSSTDRHLAGLASDHEEADTRILLHARDATIRGYQQINVVCRDTDVLVLLVAHLPNLSPDVWMFTGTAKRKLYVPVHQIRLSEDKRSSLLAFHAITGCDTTSQFVGIGKQSAWSTFVTCPGLLQDLGRDECPDDKVLSDAEAFICKLYSHGTDEVLINSERAAAFRRAKKSLDGLPPTQDALHLHIKRAHYQAFIWKKALAPCPVLPSPEGNGWHCEDGILKPKLVTKEQVTAACLELAYCGCTRGGTCCATRRCT